jgi:hypothetical protein
MFLTAYLSYLNHLFYVLTLHLVLQRPQCPSRPLCLPFVALAKKGHSVFNMESRLSLRVPMLFIGIGGPMCLTGPNRPTGLRELRELGTVT